MNNTTAPGQKAGKIMLYGSWFGALALLTFIFGAWEEQQYNPNQQPSSQIAATERTVTLQANHQHHYLATGAINSYPVTFLLDTGASDVVIPQELATKLGLKQGRSSYATTANGTVKVNHARIEYLSLGSIKLKNINAAINPGMKGEEVLLGMSALKHLEFTQRGDTLTLKQYMP